MPDSGFTVLAGDRVLLRRFDLADLASLAICIPKPSRIPSCERFWSKCLRVLARNESFV